MQEAIAIFAPNGHEVTTRTSGSINIVALSDRFFVHPPRDWQVEPIRHLVSGRNIIVQAKVGKGKSNIFASAIAKTGGLSYIVVPTIALGIDAAHHLEEAGAKVFVWSSVAKAKEKKDFKDNMEDYHAVVFAPEAMHSIPVSQHPAVLIIDEAHHIIMSSIYRSSFRDIGKFAHRLKPSAIGLFSATFEESMIEDIETMMFGFDFTKFRDKNPDRENIMYHTYDKAISREKTMEILKDNKGSAIIYAFSVSTVDNMFFQLKKGLEGLGYHVIRYHSKIKDKKSAMKTFHKERTVVIATSAFGEGINKPDVGTIIRVGMPFNLLQMVQEAGRAMRDTSLGNGHYHLFPSYMDKMMFNSNIIQKRDVDVIFNRLTDKFEKFTFKDFMRENTILNNLIVIGIAETRTDTTITYDIEFKKTATEILKGRAEYKNDIVRLMDKRQWTQLELEEYIDTPKETLKKAKNNGMLLFTPPQKTITFKRARSQINATDYQKIEAKNEKIRKDAKSLEDFIAHNEKKKFLREYFEGE